MGDMLDRAGAATEAAFGSRTPLTVFLGSLALAEVGWLALLAINLADGGVAVIVAIAGLVIVPLVAYWALRRMANAPGGDGERRG